MFKHLDGKDDIEGVLLQCIHRLDVGGDDFDALEALLSGFCLNKMALRPRITQRCDATTRVMLCDVKS